MSEKIVLVTRAEEQSKSLASALSAGGVRPVCIPTIEIIDPESWDEVDTYVSNVTRYDGLIFTSANAVKRFAARLPHSQERPTLPDVYSVGEKTAAALRRHDIDPTHIAEDSRAEGVLEILGDVHGKRYLLPRARYAREILPNTITERGGHVDIAVVYETVTAEGYAAELKARLCEGVDAVTFMSPSALRGYVEMAGAPPETMVVATIGSVTAHAAAEVGVRVDVIPESPSVEALAAAVVDALQK